MSHLIAPSVLAADFANIQRDFEMINRSNADWFHIDVMDGVFVPNISFGIPVISAMKKHAKKPLDVHLMIVNPDQYINTFKNIGADILTVHYEACSHLHRTLQAIKAEGMKAGVDAKDWNKAADEMIDSRWYKQVTNRAQRLVDRMRAV